MCFILLLCVYVVRSVLVLCLVLFWFCFVFCLVVRSVVSVCDLFCVSSVCLFAYCFAPYCVACFVFRLCLVCVIGCVVCYLFGFVLVLFCYSLCAFAVFLFVFVSNDFLFRCEVLFVWFVSYCVRVGLMLSVFYVACYCVCWMFPVPCFRCA